MGNPGELPVCGISTNQHISSPGVCLVKSSVYVQRVLDTVCVCVCLHALSLSVNVYLRACGCVSACVYFMEVSGFTLPFI